MNDIREDISQTLQLGQPKWRGRLWIWASLAAIIAVAVLWFAVLRPGGAERVEYETAIASRGDLVVTVTATGTVEPTNLVEISSELSGTLASVEVDFNDTVAVGTVLAQLDTRKLEAQLLIAKASLDAAIARVAVAQALLDDAREKYETALDLEARGVTSQQVFSTRQAAFKQAQA